MLRTNYLVKKLKASHQSYGMEHFSHDICIYGFLVDRHLTSQMLRHSNRVAKRLLQKRPQTLCFLNEKHHTFFTF